VGLLENLQQRIELWFQKEEGLYNLALESKTGDELAEFVAEYCTSDNIIASEIIDTVYAYIDWDAVRASIVGDDEDEEEDEE